jgi:hypothetical protein
VWCGPDSFGLGQGPVLGCCIYGNEHPGAKHIGIF